MYSVLKVHLFSFQHDLNYGNILETVSKMFEESRNLFGRFKKYKNDILEFYPTKLTTYTIGVFFSKKKMSPCYKVH